MKTIMKKSIKSLMAFTIACMGFGTVANAQILKRDTVYVIKSMNSSVPVGAYKVENDGNLTDTSTTNVNSGSASVGLAVCTKNKRVFISHEGSGTVDVVDGETFAKLSSLTIPGTSDIAGMVFDEDRKRLYVVDRDQTHIFVYTVDSSGNVVRVVGEEFEASDGVWGVDVWNNKLYCTHGKYGPWSATNSNTITIYDLNTKVKVDEYNTTSETNQAIAVDGSDPSNVLVYTTWANQGSTASILTQYNVNTDVERRINLERDGRGVSVNPALGHVYVATGDSSDVAAPELRTYGESQFTTLAPTTPTPLDTDPLMQGHDATDVFAAGITFNPDVYIEMIDPADKNLTVGETVTFEVTIRNSSAEYNMTLNDMEDTYNTSDISFLSTSLQTGLDDSLDDGNISWSDMGIVIEPESNITFTKTFEALREVNCSTEMITVTRAELDTPEVPTQVDPFGNTLYFDIGPACGCDPELVKRDSGSALGILSALMLAMFTLLFGSLAIRRSRTNI